MTPTTRFDPDRLASLESERDFLLRSLADLEAEREAGNLDDERYRALKDDYTARAAAVLRSIEEGPAALPEPAPLPRRRKLATGGVLAAFVLVVALALSAALGDRQDGQTATGNAQSANPSGGQPPSDRRAALERQLAENPNDPAAHLVYARYLVEVGELPDAVKEYVAAAKLDPKNPEAHAYAGWVTFLAAQSSNAEPQVAADLIDRALIRLDSAVQAAPDYPDAHFFRGMVQLRGKSNAKAAVPDFERYLALVPDGPLNDQVNQLLDQARKQAG